MSKGRSETSIIWRTVVYAGAMLATPGCPHPSSDCVEEPVAAAPIEPGATDLEPATPVEGRATITVITEPPGADVYINGEVQGITPFRTTVVLGNTIDLVVVRAGYDTVRRDVTADQDATIDLPLTASATASRARCSSEGKHGRGFILS